MMKADAFNLYIDPVRTEMTDTQHIPISHVCDLYKSESKYILTDEKLLQVRSTDEEESESVIVDESSTEESEPESLLKVSTQTKKNMQLMRQIIRRLW